MMLSGVDPAEFKLLMSDICLFARYGSGLRLRSYQRQAARAIVSSVMLQNGLSIIVMFPRQSGKNELQAQIETYLLTILSYRQAEIVKISPTWKPQSQNAMRRLERVLKSNYITNKRWIKECGYIYSFKAAQMTFLSGESTSNIVGATASTLLEVDEAQDILISKYDKEIAPMVASTNATRVFWGTAWTSNTLLARELRAARQAQELDGIQRVFIVTADDVAAEVSAYKAFVEEQVAKLGRNHPMIKTQYFSEEIDGEGGMFPPARRQLMQGSHRRQLAPVPGLVYALLLDVAGEDEGQSSSLESGNGSLANAGRDSTALTVVEVDLSSIGIKRYPTYRVVDRKLWTGTKHTTLFGQLSALTEAWGARWIVVDATGVGAGLASFLEKAFPGRVIPFIFSGSSKSKLGWDFLGVIESGRFLDWVPPLDGSKDERDLFQRQAEHCRMEVIPGPERRLRWSVSETQRDPETGELLHDDLLLSAALCALLDAQEWGLARSEVIDAFDPLDELTW
jgi:hypothetical protein